MAETYFMLDLKSKIAKSTLESEMIRVKKALNREDSTIAAEHTALQWGNRQRKCRFYSLCGSENDGHE